MLITSKKKLISYAKKIFLKSILKACTQTFVESGL